ncbi:transporter [Roseovarius sp. D22-M7]|uniref:transporter n=1 Tax=Roseovarius sp. D22-M7 TaxID=3127116 RepID=UPI00301031B9
MTCLIKALSLNGITGFRDILVMGAMISCASPAIGGKARDYLNAPVNTWVTFYNLGFSNSVAPVDGAADFGITDVTTDVTSQSLILSRILDIGGRTGGLSFVLPHADIDVAAGPFGDGDAGIGDVGIVAEVNLFGAPALSKEAFGAWDPETFSSFHLLATFPTGAYDPESLVNVGSNRWSLAPTVNYSYTPDAGWTWLEIYTTARFFGDNTDAPGTAETLEQDPLYQIELHASRNLTPDFWLTADAYYNWGGETRLDGVAQDNAADTLSLGAGLGWRIPSVATVFVNYETTVSAPAGQPEGETVRLTLAKVW